MSHRFRFTTVIPFSRCHPSCLMSHRFLTVAPILSLFVHFLAIFCSFWKLTSLEFRSLQSTFKELVHGVMEQGFYCQGCSERYVGFEDGSYIGGSFQLRGCAGYLECGMEDMIVVDSSRPVLTICVVIQHAFASSPLASPGISILLTPPPLP